MNINNPASSEAEIARSLADQHPEDIALLESFDRNELKSNKKYSYEIDFFDNYIVVERYNIDIEYILKMKPQTVRGFKSTVRAIAKSSTRAPSTLRGMIGKLAKAVRDVQIDSFTPENYQKLISGASNDPANACLYFLTLWHELGYPGVGGDTIEVAQALRRPSSQGRSRAASDDPTEGWYTTQEYDDLVDVYWKDYESGKVSLRNTVALLLNAQFARRGIQMANLKICDFQQEGMSDGVTGKRIAFPGAKDRQAEEWFRGSKFEVHPVGDDLWDLCQQQIASSVSVYEDLLGRELTAEQRLQLPFLPTHFSKAVRAEMQAQTFPLNERLASPYLHITSGGVSQLLSRNYGTPVVSHRTGEFVKEFAYRMRHSRARQLARLGVPRLTLQYWLGHEYDGSIEWYYNDPAEDARMLNDELQLILAPLSQAFFGTVRDSESEATRGNDPASRVELDGRHSVGSCGEHGHCSASVPIPCYRCTKFEPWVDGPHDEVLIRLYERQEEENNIHIPSKARRMLVPLQLNRDIEAVKLVIRVCDARKKELAQQQAENAKSANESSETSAVNTGTHRSHEFSLDEITSSAIDKDGGLDTLGEKDNNHD